MQTTIKQNSKDKMYLSISVFCEQSQWSALILNKILPFLEKTKEVDGYVLSLSRNRGDHIKLFLITTQSKTKELAEKISIHFGQLFPPNQFLEKPSLIPKNGIFSDFATNTVHYGLYDGHYRVNYFQDGLSVLVVLIFQKHNSETIPSLTEIMIEFFALYHDYSGFSKEKIIEIFENELENEFKKYTAQTLEKVGTTISKNFNRNKLEIISFLKSKPWQKKILDPDHDQWSTMILENMELEPKIRQNMIAALCEAFDFEDKINAYYLFVNALKQIE